jgi:hypothetical protein
MSVIQPVLQDKKWKFLKMAQICEKIIFIKRTDDFRWIDQLIGKTIVEKRVTTITTHDNIRKNNQKPTTTTTTINYRCAAMS